MLQSGEQSTFFSPNNEIKEIAIKKKKNQNFLARDLKKKLLFGGEVRGICEGMLCLNGH